MKRIKLFIILMLLCITTKVYAIEDYYVEATIQNNGDLIVEKYIYSKDTNITEVIQYDDYYVRSVNNDLKYYWVNSNNDASGIIMEKILEVEKNKLFNFDNVQGNNLSYNETKDNGKKFYEIDKLNNSNKAIYMKYRLEGINVLNLDVGELFFRIFTDEYKNTKINNFKLRINIPNNVNELKYWGNGINNLYNIGMTLISTNVNNLVIDDNIDIRMIFDDNVISNSKNKSFREVRDRIIKYEDYAIDKQQRELLDTYNNCSIAILNQMCEFEINHLLKNLPEGSFKQEIVNSLDELKETMNENSNKDIWQNALDDDRKLDLPPEAEKKYQDVRICCYIYVLLFVLYYGYAIYVAKYKYRTLAKDTILRDFPSDIRPSAVTFLLKGKINAKAISADILDLIHKKIIITRKDPLNEKNYILEINSEKKDNLSSNEHALLKLVFNHKVTTTTDDFRKESIFNKNNFKSRCSNYIYTLLQEYKHLYFFDKRSKGKFIIIASLYLCLAVIIMVGLIDIIQRIIPLELSLSHYPKAQLTFSLMFISFLLGAIMIGIISKVIYRTKYGQEEYWKWMAFKNFLISFGTMDEKKVLEVFLWEKYLIYATALDCANIVEKRLGFRVFNSFDVDVAYNDIFGEIEENFNENITKDFSTLTENSFRFANKRLKKYEKAERKALKEKNKLNYK